MSNSKNRIISSRSKEVRVEMVLRVVTAVNVGTEPV